MNLAGPIVPIPSTLVGKTAPPKAPPNQQDLVFAPLRPDQVAMAKTAGTSRAHVSSETHGGGREPEPPPGPPRTKPPLPQPPSPPSKRSSGKRGAPPKAPPQALNEAEGQPPIPAKTGNMITLEIGSPPPAAPVEVPQVAPQGTETLEGTCPGNATGPNEATEGNAPTQHGCDEPPREEQQAHLQEEETSPPAAKDAAPGKAGAPEGAVPTVPPTPKDAKTTRQSATEWLSAASKSKPQSEPSSTVSPLGAHLTDHSSMSTGGSNPLPKPNVTQGSHLQSETNVLTAVQVTPGTPGEPSSAPPPAMWGDGGANWVAAIATAEDNDSTTHLAQSSSGATLEAARGGEDQELFHPGEPVATTYMAGVRPEDILLAHNAGLSDETRNFSEAANRRYDELHSHLERLEEGVEALAEARCRHDEMYRLHHEHLANRAARRQHVSPTELSPRDEDDTPGTPSDPGTAR